MSTQTITKQVRKQEGAQVAPRQWLMIGLGTALAAIIPVLAAQALALSVWPEAAAFKPLDSYPRTAVFTLIPALIATAVFARLAVNRQNPEMAFIKVAVVVLLLSFIPDYVLPVPGRTFLSSSIAAFLHIIAGTVTTAGILIGYQRSAQK